ncbi:MAG: hypothetical protein ACM34K_15470 [Bacillota bacterium]
MAGHEIKQNEWISFINDFNKKNRDKLVDIEVTDDKKNKVEERVGLPLKEVAVSLTDKEYPIISFIAGASNEASHHIGHASHLVYEETDNGNPKALRIESSKGRSAKISFQNTP